MGTTTSTLVAPDAVAPEGEIVEYAAVVEKERPHIRSIVKHLSFSILMANVVPSVLFYLCMTLGSVSLALVSALVWCYGAMAWRLSTKRRASGLLIITIVGLTAKTLMALASGSTFMYFLQPAITDGIVAALFLSSLTTARPVVARLAADFYPMDADIAERPRIQKLFWNLTLFWAVICLAKSFVTFYLLEEFSTPTFVALKGIFILVMIISGAAVTVFAAARVAHSEGLLHRTSAA